MKSRVSKFISRVSKLESRVNKLESRVSFLNQEIKKNNRCLILSKHRLFSNKTYLLLCKLCLFFHICISQHCIN